MDQQGNAGYSYESAQLLRSIAYELRVPLTSIARRTELGVLQGGLTSEDAQIISMQATSGLTLVDSYLLGLELLHGQTQLELEPVSLSALLLDLTEQLKSVTKHYKAFIELQIDGRFGPVMAHAQGLRLAFIALAHTLLENLNQDSRGRTLTIGVYKTDKGIHAGIYGNQDAVLATAWRSAMKLQSTAEQPLRNVSGSGVGLFVTETILEGMATHLRPSKRYHQQGFATVFQPSQQLIFV